MAILLQDRDDRLDEIINTTMTLPRADGKGGALVLRES